MFGKKRKKKGQGRFTGFDYSTREMREQTVSELYAKAKNARAAVENRWVQYNDYYNFLHNATAEVREAVEESGICWDPAVVPDPYIQVESQVDPVVPEPEFRGRDDDQDNVKAKQREYAVKFVCQNNRLDDLNTSNERRLVKLGDAFWKVYWDDQMPCGDQMGDIRIRDVPVEAIYADPTAGSDGIQAGQFVDYVYRLHKVVFWQMYGDALKREGLELEDVLESEYTVRGGIFDMESTIEESDDTVQVIEHWFRHPEDEDGAEAGDIGCSIQAGGHEVKYIPKYWQRTGLQNKRFPFVHYWRVRNENGFYNCSEIQPILPMVDAADRELANALLNDAFTANDIILQEENALADGEEMTNTPGAVVKTKPNAIGKVARLGGLQSGKNSLPMIEWLLSQIQRTNRNYETNQGKASGVKTATELSMMRADVDSQMEIKKADRNGGFVRLYELIDWSVLEFYEDQREIYIGAKKPDEKPVSFTLITDAFDTGRPAITDPITGEMVQESTHYWPMVDVTVNAGDGIIRSKAATLQALQNLVGVQVTQDNYKLMSAMVEVLDIPQKQEITQEWQDRFSPAVPPEVIQALGQDPQLLQLVTQAVTAKQMAQGAQGMPGAPMQQGAAAQMPGGLPSSAQFDLMGGGASGVPAM
jgi:hypothetical protein|nr:MAG TPA: Portal protein [Caudoviricetes sp.]